MAPKTPPYPWHPLNYITLANHGRDARATVCTVDPTEDTGQAPKTAPEPCHPALREIVESRAGEKTRLGQESEPCHPITYYLLLYHSYHYIAVCSFLCGL